MGSPMQEPTHPYWHQGVCCDTVGSIRHLGRLFGTGPLANIYSGQRDLDQKWGSYQEDTATQAAVEDTKNP